MSRTTLVWAMGTFFVVSVVLLGIAGLNEIGISRTGNQPTPEEVKDEARTQKERKDWAGDWIAWVNRPSPDEVIEAFKKEGAEVGKTYPVEQESPSLLPKTYTEAVRFEIPSMGVDDQGEGQGGRVFAFDSTKDLEVVANHYKSAEQMPVFGPRLHSHLYRNGLILVQINGDLPRDQARRYGKALKGM